MKAIEENDTKDRRKIYKLWWEYLRRSDGYKAFCEKYPDAVKNTELFGIYSIDTSHLRDFPEDDAIIDPDYDEYCEEKKKWRRASCFCNVHKDSFEVWWKKFTHYSDEESTIEELSTHIDGMMKHAYLSTVEKSIKSTYKDFVSTYKDSMSDKDYESMDKGFIYWAFVRKSLELRNEAFREFIKRPEHKALHEFMERPDLPYIYLRINADAFTTDDIKEIKRIIRRKKEDFIKRRDGNYTMHKTYFKEVGRIRYDELQRYLKIYDLKITGMKWPDIFKKTYPNKEWNELNRRSIRTEYDKAKKIVKNVENGNFPGKYY